MANVYYQTSMQLIFAVNNRNAMIRNDFKKELHQYIGGILINKKHKPLAINSIPDHIHIFFGMHPCDIPALVRDLKSDSSFFINEKKLTKYKFNWQEGYGLFWYSMSHRSDVIKYIDNQKEHHNKISFKDEYIEFLKKFQVEYNAQYLFDFFDSNFPDY